VGPVNPGLADLLPGKNPGSQLKSDCLHPRAAGLDVWNKEKYLVHSRIQSPDLPARSGVVTSLPRLSYSTFLSTNYVILRLLILFIYLFIYLFFCLNLSATALPV